MISKGAAMRETKVDAATPAPVVFSRLFGRAREKASSDHRRNGFSRSPSPPSLSVRGPPSSDTLIQSFNSWAFKREQPGNLERLKRLAEAAIESAAPLSFVLYWGRGPRVDVAAPKR